MTTDKQVLPCYPNKAGIYILTDADEYILYIGIAEQLCQRVSHLTALQQDNTSSAGFSHIQAGLVRKHQEKKGEVFVEFIECDDYLTRQKELIIEHNPPWNQAAR